MRKIFAILFLAGLIVPVGLCQWAGKKMPVTTSSDKAREIYIHATDLKQNIEYALGDKLLKQALELDPDFALAHYRLYTIAGNKKAMELMRFVTPAEAFLIRSQNAAFSGNPKLAAVYADSAASLFPKDPTVLHDVGNTIANTDRARGVRILEKTIELEPNFAPSYNNLGYFYMYDGKNDLAEKSFIRYLELRPTSGNGHDSYGDFLMMTGKNTEAIEQYRMAFQNEPTFNFALVKSGWAHMRKGEFDLARENFNEFDQAAQNENEHLGAIMQNALLCYMEGDIKKAFTHLDAMKKKAIELKNPLYNIYEGTYKGWMQMEAANPAGAVTYFRQVLAQIPTAGLDSAGISNLSMHHHGFLCMAMANNGQLAEAQKEITLAKQIFDGRSRGVDETNFMNLYLGVLEYNRKNYKQAIELMEPGATLNQSVPHQFYTALAYDKIGNMKKAQEFYAMANLSIDTNFAAFYYNKTKKRLEELKRVQ